jgi:hypothetical protein
MYDTAGVEVKVIYYSILGRPQNSLAHFTLWPHLTEIDKVGAKFCTRIDCLPCLVYRLLRWNISTFSLFFLFWSIYRGLWEHLAVVCVCLPVCVSPPKRSGFWGLWYHLAIYMSVHPPPQFLLGDLWDDITVCVSVCSLLIFLVFYVVRVVLKKRQLVLPRIFFLFSAVHSIHEANFMLWPHLTKRESAP